MDGQDTLTAIGLALFGYLLGSIPVGLLVGRLKGGIDIRNYGSGKTGMTNTLRTLGKGPAIVVLVGDVLKGLLPVLLARYFTDDARVHVVAALLAIIGHDFPVYAGFRGGRGVATTLGATLGLMPPLGLLIPAVGSVILYRTRYVSLVSVSGGVVGVVVPPLLVLAGRIPAAYAVFGVIAGALIIVLHHDNIRRLLAGAEPRIGATR